MREHLGPAIIANEVRMRRQGWRGAFLLLEGDTDARFYRRFVHHECAVVAHGKENVIACLRLLLDSGFQGVAAIVDRDMWVLGEGAMPALEGLMATDGRDLESMVLRSPALDAVLAMYGSREKQAGLQAAGQSVVEVLLRAGSEIGYLRWLCERDKRREDRDEASALAPDGRLRLKFKGLDFAKFLQRRTLEVDRGKLIKTISGHSMQWPDPTRIEEALAELRAHAAAMGYEGWPLCAGHDLVELLRIGLCSCFGSCAQKDIPSLDLSLLAAFGEHHFRQTELFAEMQVWSEAHPAHHLLASRPTGD